MEVLRDFGQIKSKNSIIFNNALNDVPILDQLGKDYLKQISKNISLTADLKTVSNLAELIFQLRDYRPALENYVKLFLYTKFYDAIVVFVGKLFVAHVGSNYFASKSTNYSHQERFFDRFIEIVRGTDLSLADYVDFLFEIIESDSALLASWKRPATEYVQDLIRENEKDLWIYIETHPSRQKIYFEMMLEYNTQKALTILFENELDSEINSQLINLILKKYFDETMAFFDKNLPTAKNRLHYIKILASIENNPQVQARLEDIFDDEKDEEIRSFIKNKLGIVGKAKNYKCSPLHFETLSRKKVENLQTRTLNISFERISVKYAETGQQASNYAKTFITQLFKDQSELENLYLLKDVCDIFEDGLYDFADKLFATIKKYPDIKKAKWAIRLVSLASKDVLEKTLCDFCHSLFLDSSKIKQAKYLLECLISSKKPCVMGLMSSLTSEGVESFVLNSKHYYEMYSKMFNMQISDIVGLLEGDEVSEELIQEHSKKLFESFIENKYYKPNLFEQIFVNKKLYNHIAQGIVFGEYKGDRLCSLFVLDGQNRQYILGLKPFIDPDMVIKIVHGLDLDRWQDAKNFANNKYFDQFQQTNVDVKNFAKSVCVSSLHGILVNVQSFIKNLNNKGFSANLDFSGTNIDCIYFGNLALNILSVVEFEKPIKREEQNSSIGYIRFYRQSECMKQNNSYILNKSKALAVKDVPYRLFDYVMSSIYGAIKN